MIGTRDGFVLLDPGTGTLLAHHVEPAGVVGAGMVPGHDAVVIASLAEPLGTLAVVSW